MAVACIRLIVPHIEVAGVNQTGIGSETTGAAAKLAALHEILERRESGIGIAEGCVRDLIEDHNLARAENTDGSRRQIDEEIRRRGPSAGDCEDTRRHIAQQEGFARLSWSQLNQIEVWL